MILPMGSRAAHLLLLAALLVLPGCGAATPAASGRPAVVAALYPLAFLAEGVGGDEIEVVNLGAGAGDPHDLELTPRQVRTIREAALVVHMGRRFQPGVEAVTEQMPQERIFQVLSLPEVASELRRVEPEDGHEGQEKGSEGDDHALDYDPHVWLDPILTQEVVRALGAKLSAVDRENAEEHTRGAEELAGRLGQLDQRFREGLADCARREIVTSHSAFGYLAARYGLTEVGITGLSPEAEASPRRMAEVASFARQRAVETIFFEKTVSPRIAESLAREVGVSTDVLDPIEVEPDSGDYFGAMETNLQSLRKALECK
ncbi:MAG: metal ABC transporter substrate-binding protein [Actinomycetota bacterium]|nr:metal ABC transporter substrate-binding protein [Actinomycetota bacterium]